MIFDYDTLKIIWMFIIGTLIIGFAVTGGYDLGVGALLPFLAKTDDERRLMLKCIGPTWEGNQVWLITAAGTIFAAWPFFYAALFSNLYFAILLILLALILRPPGIDYRSKLPSLFWRTCWDWGLFFSGFVPLLVFGIAIGNLLLGLSFYYDETLLSHFTASFWSLFHPYALLIGLTTLSLLLMDGALFIQLKTIDALHARAKSAVFLFGILFIILFMIALIWTLYGLPGYQVNFMPDLNKGFAPFDKEVSIGIGYWAKNYSTHSWGFLLPLASLLCTGIALVSSKIEKVKTAMFFGSCTVASVILTAGFTLFPFLMPSSIKPNHSLTIWDATSSHLTLTWMFWAVLFLYPIIIAYTTWVFYIMRGKVLLEREPY